MACKNCEWYYKEHCVNDKSEYCTENVSEDDTCKEFISKRKIYIAGPVSNKDNFKECFAKAEEELRGLGYIVLNPSILPAGLTQQEYMSICIPMLYMCDEIYMLEEWENSVGATIEFRLAKQAGKLINVEKEIQYGESLNSHSKFIKENINKSYMDSSNIINKK